MTYIVLLVMPCVLCHVNKYNSSCNVYKKLIFLRISYGKKKALDSFKNLIFRQISAESFHHK